MEADHKLEESATWSQTRVRSQKILLQKGWWIPGLWWTRIEVRSARIRNYEPHPIHHQNRRLEDVWLAEQ